VSPPAPPRSGDTLEPVQPATGAVPPERRRRLRTVGLELCLSEWGDPEAPPLLCTHGMFDHGRGFDRLAPLLAEHFRVIALDARGHGDSDWADAYLWPADVWDIVHVLRSLGRPAHLVGHSKGGGQATDAASLAPECVRKLVNIDGFGPPPEGFGPPGRPAPEEPLCERLGGYLDTRRHAATRMRWRVYPSLDELVARRQAQNPRLDAEWLRYFVACGARRVEGGYCWKVDPFAAGGFGPFKVEWIAPGWEQVRAPVLALIGSVPDTWGPLPPDILEPRLAHFPSVELAVIEDAGHFAHMERPHETARVILDFLDRGPA